MITKENLMLKVIPSTNQLDKETFIQEITYKLESCLEYKREIVILCIGTDCSTGDAFGPLVGSLLKKNDFDLPVYGTIENPVDALNLNDNILFIQQKYNNPIILTVDASLGKKEQIGLLYFKMGSIMPGKAASKKLPKVGDAHLCAVVNELDSRYSPKKIHETRLYHVFLLANETVKILMELCSLLSMRRKYIN